MRKVGVGKGIGMILKGKRIVVTGAASGIGAATVRACASAGAAIVGLDVADETGRKVAEQANGLGPGRVSFAHCDIGCRVGSAAKNLGGIDVLVHAAGIARLGLPEDVTEDDLDTVLNINIRGTIFLNQAVFAAMREEGGAIINVASMAGVTGSVWAPAYSASKGGVLGWTRSIARSWGKHGIRANAVCPLIKTPMADQLFTTDVLQSQEQKSNALRQMIPLGGELGDADSDMAPVMVFLASDMSRFMTGQTISVDGGALIIS